MAKKTIKHDVFGLPVRADGIDSRNKGVVNERLVCKFLEKWTGRPFARVPSSGGLRWKNNSSVCGDVVCEDEDFDMIFSVETKHRKDLVFKEMLQSNSMIYRVWEQAKADAERARKEPMLILRNNGMPRGKYIVFFGGVAGTVMKSLLKGSVSEGYSKEAKTMLRGFHSEDVLKVGYHQFCEYLELK